MRVRSRVRESAKKVMSRPMASFTTGKRLRTMKEKTEEIALRIPFPFERASFGKSSEDIRFGKLSGPIWTKKVRTEVTMIGIHLEVRPILKRTTKPKMA